MKFYTYAELIGQNVHLRGYDEQGERVQTSEVFRPRAWMLHRPGKNNLSKFVSIFEDQLTEIQFDSTKEANEFIRQYEDVDIPIFMNRRHQYQYLIEKFKTVDFDISHIRWMALDIECTCEGGFPDPGKAQETVNAITMFLNGKHYCLGLKKVELDRSKFQFPVQYEHYDNEYELLERFVNLWEAFDIDIVTGWNVSGFDMPYLINRISNVLGAKSLRRLSYLGKVRSTVEVVEGREIHEPYIAGVQILDYLQLYKKFTYGAQESYKLDYIANHEIGKGKLEIEGAGPSHLLYRTDYKSFIEYNIIDVELVVGLNEKLQFINLAIILAYQNKVNFEDVYSQVRMWEVCFADHLYYRGIVAPAKNDKPGKDQKIEGAYVKIPDPGAKNWVVSFDLDSLYPNLIRMYNISPETLVNDPEEYMKVVEISNKRFDADGTPHLKFDFMMNTRLPIQMFIEGRMPILHPSLPYCIAFNGAMFRKDKQGFIPKVIQEVYQKRRDAKNKMLSCRKKMEAIKTELKKREVAA